MKRRTNETRKVDELLPPVASDVPLSEWPLPLPAKGDENVRTSSERATYSEVLGRTAVPRPGNREAAWRSEMLLERLSVPEEVRRRRRKTVLIATICAIVLAAAVLALINIH